MLSTTFSCVVCTQRRTDNAMTKRKRTNEERQRANNDLQTNTGKLKIELREPH